MGRNLTCFLFLFCFAISAPTQLVAQHQQSVVFGLEIGAGLSRLVYDNPREDGDESGRASFTGMAFAIVPLFKPVYLQTGLRLHNVGGEVGFEVLEEDQLVNVDFEIVQNYISIPLRLHIALGNEGLYVMGGVEGGYLLSATLSQQIGGSLNEQEASVTDNLSRFNVSALGGLGYLFELSRGQMYFQGQYSRGLTGMDDNDGSTFFWFSDWVTQDVTLAVGLIF